jgi:hypothetical protein
LFLKKDFKKIFFLRTSAYGQSQDAKEAAMSLQNPVFIPGPTNIPENLRKACDMPTVDHRSPFFGSILHPALDRVRQILKSQSAKSSSFRPPEQVAGKQR